MKNIKLNILVFNIFLGICFSDIIPNIPKHIPSTNSNREDLKLVLAIMVEFQEEVNDEASTSGNGLFLQSLEDNLNFINYNDILRCNPEEHMVLDPPPHNGEYFKSQLNELIVFKT